MKLDELNKKVRAAYDAFEFHHVYHSIHNFCVVDMSNFYLDVLKDRLYTEKADSELRRAAQTTIYKILDSMTRLISPILAYTSDEIWKFMKHGSNCDSECVLFNDMPELVGIDLGTEFEAKWDKIHELRDTVKKSLEVAVKDKVIRSSLEAKVTLTAAGAEYNFLKDAEPELKAAFIVSDVEILSDDELSELKVEVAHAEGEKCERCWCFSKYVGTDKVHPTLCKRCAELLK